jgi:membrane associated rhomboid family serine protease
MIVIPLSGRISWSNPPYLTITLIVMNCLAFLFFQLKDNSRHVEAIMFYVESGLAAIEVRAYTGYLNSVSTEQNEPVDAKKLKEEEFNAYLAKIMADAPFQKKLRAGYIIREGTPDYPEWKNLRDEYDAKMGRIVSYRFGFKPGFPSALTMFTHMFLHGGLGHLLGNMIFLWLSGCLVETAMKRAFFFPAYLFTGVCAVSLFWVCNVNSGLPLVGASGAISGLMGLLTLLYGMNRIRVFYSLGFYFNYIKAPAILLLPIWVGVELFSEFWGAPSNTAYLAHVGGFIGGGTAGLLIARVLHADKPEVVKEAPVDRSPRFIEQALKAAGELKIKEAMAILDTALTEYPGHPEILKHQYRVARMDPENTDIHSITGRLLTVYCSSDGNYEKARDLYDDYLEAVAKPKLPLPAYVRLAVVYISLGDTDRAEKFIALFLRKKSDMPELPVMLLKLARVFKEQGNSGQYEKYRRLLIERFPESRESMMMNNSDQALTPSR